MLFQAGARYLQKYFYSCCTFNPVFRFCRSNFFIRTENLYTMKLDTPEFQSLFTPEIKALSSLFDKYGYELRIAGGAVRDLLSGVVPSDLDFATTATPDQMKEMFRNENVRMINKRGESHGTITARINDKENFEITTLRIDVVTDGRRAQVKYTTDWQLDSNRRDLTVNSMFLGLDGVIYDYFNGYEDLKNKKVRFVGDSETRIKEDYLRILRYFRFFGRIVPDPHQHLDGILDVIKKNMSGLDRVSGERLWVEVKKILLGRFPWEILDTMLQLGIGQYLGLPADPDFDEFRRVWTRCQDVTIHPNTILSSLLRNETEVMTMVQRLKVSAYERDLTLFIINRRTEAPCEDPLRSYKFLIIDHKGKMSDAFEWVLELLKYRGQPELQTEIRQWEIPRFPVNGHMLMARGIPAGKYMKIISLQLREHWKESNFMLTSDELLKFLPEIVSDVNARTNAEVVLHPVEEER